MPLRRHQIVDRDGSGYLIPPVYKVVVTYCQGRREGPLTTSIGTEFTSLGTFCLTENNLIVYGVG
jgi:hypothetical protein